MKPPCSRRSRSSAIVRTSCAASSETSSAPSATNARTSLEMLASWPQVERVMPVQKRFKLVSREGQKNNSVIPVRGNLIGGKKFQVMAGPCSVEDEKQLMATAHAVQEGRRDDPAREALSNRALPLRISGAGREGTEAAGQGAPRNRPGHHHRTAFRATRGDWSPSTRTSFRSARGTRRISNCSSPPPRRANPSCSSAASP